MTVDAVSWGRSGCNAAEGGDRALPLVAKVVRPVQLSEGVPDLQSCSLRDPFDNSVLP